MKFLRLMVGLLILFMVGESWGQITPLSRPQQSRSASPSSASVEVPEVRGWKQDQATQRLERAGLTPKVEPRKSTRPQGTVLSQDPEPGTQVNRNSQVRLGVAEP